MRVSTPGYALFLFFEYFSSIWVCPMIRLLFWLFEYAVCFKCSFDSLVHTTFVLYTCSSLCSFLVRTTLVLCTCSTLCSSLSLNPTSARCHSFDRPLCLWAFGQPRGSRLSIAPPLGGWNWWNSFFISLYFLMLIKWPFHYLQPAMYVVQDLLWTRNIREYDNVVSTLVLCCSLEPPLTLSWHSFQDRKTWQYLSRHTSGKLQKVFRIPVKHS